MKIIYQQYKPITYSNPAGNPNFTLHPNNTNKYNMQRNPNGYLWYWKSVSPISHPTYSEKKSSRPSNFRPFPISDLQPDTHSANNIQENATKASNQGISHT